MSEERTERNQVFGAPVTAPQAPRPDFGIDLPVETVPLPSSGLCYPQGHPFHGRKTIDIRCMTAREEDILTNSSFMKKGTIISELIGSCLVDRDVSPTDLLVGDRHALMVAIRVTGYGADYDAEVQCNECEAKSQTSFDLASLPIRRLTIQPVAPGVNLFETTLPLTKKVVRFKFLTGRDEETMAATAAQQKKLNMPAGTATVTTSLLTCLQSIDGVDDRSKVAAFVRMMPARDSLALRSYIRDNEPGIMMRQEVTCPNCNHGEEIAIPMGISFLWPGVGK